MSNYDDSSFSCTNMKYPKLNYTPVSVAIGGGGDGDAEVFKVEGKGKGIPEPTVGNGKPVPEGKPGKPDGVPVGNWRGTLLWKVEGKGNGAPELPVGKPGKPVPEGNGKLEGNPGKPDEVPVGNSRGILVAGSGAPPEADGRWVRECLPGIPLPPVGNGRPVPVPVNPPVPEGNWRGNLRDIVAVAGSVPRLLVSEYIPGPQPPVGAPLPKPVPDGKLIDEGSPVGNGALDGIWRGTLTKPVLLADCVGLPE